MDRDRVLRGQVELLGEAGLSFHQGADSGAVVRARRSVQRAVLPSRVEISAQISTAWPALGLSQSVRHPCWPCQRPDPLLLRQEPGRARSNREAFQRWHELGRAVLRAQRRAVLPDLCSGPAHSHLDGSDSERHALGDLSTPRTAAVPTTSAAYPGPPGYDEWTTSTSTRVYVASFAGNQPTAT